MPNTDSSNGNSSKDGHDGKMSELEQRLTELQSQIESALNTDEEQTVVDRYGDNIDKALGELTDALNADMQTSDDPRQKKQLSEMIGYIAQGKSLLDTLTQMGQISKDDWARAFTQDKARGRTLADLAYLAYDTVQKHLDRHDGHVPGNSDEFEADVVIPLQGIVVFAFTLGYRAREAELNTPNVAPVQSEA